jgi:hypothetical protein
MLAWILLAKYLSEINCALNALKPRFCFKRELLLALHHRRQLEEISGNNELTIERRFSKERRPRRKTVITDLDTPKWQGTLSEGAGHVGEFIKQDAVDH